MTIKSRVQYDGMNDDVTFWLIRADEPPGTRQRAVITWEDYERGTIVPPTMEGRWADSPNRAVLQAIVDAAYDGGIRPSADVKGENAALRGHLSDMRRLVFGTFKIDEPKS